MLLHLNNCLESESWIDDINNVRPQVSLTAPNRDHFAPVSLTFFWMQLPKLKN